MTCIVRIDIIDWLVELTTEYLRVADFFLFGGVDTESRGQNSCVNCKVFAC